MGILTIQVLIIANTMPYRYVNQYGTMPCFACRVPYPHPGKLLSKDDLLCDNLKYEAYNDENKEETDQSSNHRHVNLQ